MRWLKEELNAWWRAQPGWLRGLFDTLPGVQWWEFWNPGSGLRGAFIMAVVFFCLTVNLW